MILVRILKFFGLKYVDDEKLNDSILNSKTQLFVVPTELGFLSLYRMEIIYSCILKIHLLIYFYKI